MKNARHCTLEGYVRRRLGTGSPLELLGRSFARAFTAPTPAAFWHYWNPVYGYMLSRYCYRPLRRTMPHGPALVLTFAVSGFVLHDLLLWPLGFALRGRPFFPFVTVAFSCVGIFVLSCERTRLSYAAWRPFVRFAAHGFVASATAAIAVAMSYIT